MKLFALATAGLLVVSAAATASAQGPTDPQIASIVVTANQVDIDAGKLASATSKNAEVMAFAKMMVTDHTGVNKQAVALVTKLKVTPEDNPTSQSLKDGGVKNLANLKTLKGAAFDKAYVANEVAYHKAVDSALETQLIPSANNAELKSLLQTGLKIFQGHEQHAEHVAAGLK